jgi:hypothetical protein
VVVFVSLTLTISNASAVSFGVCIGLARELDSKKG